jgi:hypothetical protein
MRHDDDCGVACLATLVPCDWEFAWVLLEKAGAFPDDESFATTRRGLYKAIRRFGLRVGIERGTPDVRGPAGLMFVRAAGEWQRRSHWLVWERTPAGIVSVFDPATGENFEYRAGALHARGLSLLFWTTVTKRNKSKGRVTCTA